MSHNVGRHRAPERYNPLTEIGTVISQTGTPLAKGSAVLAASGGLVAAIAIPAQASTAADQVDATPVQAAACAALNGPQDMVEANRALYHKRRDVLVEVFGRAGWDIPPPRASMFAWAPLPPSLAHMGSLEFSKQMLEHADVAVAPGVGYGEDGEGFVRIALVENEQRLRQAARNLRRWFQQMGLNTPASHQHR